MTEPSTKRQARHKDLPFYGSTERGPNGRRLCRLCGAEVPKGRQTWCGDQCVHDWLMRSSPGYVRGQVFKRDKGLCARCGHRERYRNGGWDAHHVVAVVEGGGLCGLQNYQTLCRECHKQETAALAKRRAQERRQPRKAATLFQEDV